MDWGEAFQGVEKEKQRIIEKEREEEKVWEKGLQRAESILPQVKEVFDVFVGIICRSRRIGEVRRAERSFWISLDYYENPFERNIIGVVIHPFCPACAKEIIGGDYIRVGIGKVANMVPEKIRLKHLVARSFSRGDRYSERYNHVEAEFIKIPFKDFAKKKLAEALNDIYVAVSGAENKYIND